MKKFTMTDVQCLAGNWTLAAKQLGFEIISRRALPGGFGNSVVEANRKLLGQFPVETGPQESWTPVETDILVGTPPCAGFSYLNSVNRGIDSPIHVATWDLIRYAARCFDSVGQAGPAVVATECVQAAYTEGKSLMEQYFRFLVETTGQPYKLTHVLMSGSSVGAACERKRYFWIASKLPLGLDVDTAFTPRTLRDAIWDLATPGNQGPKFGKWPHVSKSTAGTALIIEIFEKAGWRPGLRLRDACFQLRDEGRLPQAAEDRWFEQGCWKNFAGPKISEPDLPMQVLTGGASGDFCHYTEHRFLTVLEACRIMGLPDDWVIPGNSVNKSFQWLGKNAPMESLLWITRWIREALEGRPGPLQGDLVDVTHAWKGDHFVRVEPRST